MENRITTIYKYLSRNVGHRTDELFQYPTDEHDQAYQQALDDFYKLIKKVETSVSDGWKDGKK